MKLTNYSFNSSLKSLSDLHLSNNGYTELDPNLLKRLHNLHELYLNGNNLVYMHRYFLENNPFLKVLEFSNNQLTTIEETFSYHKNWFYWMSIRLDGNKLKTIALGKKPTKILSLDVSRNQIKYIQVRVFFFFSNFNFYLRLWKHIDQPLLDPLHVFSEMVCAKSREFFLFVPFFGQVKKHTLT